MNQFKELLWIVKRSLIMDAKTIKRCPFLSFQQKISLIVKKYWLVLKHVFIKFEINKHFLKLDGHPLYYNSPYGFAGYQAVLCEHLYWLGKIGLPDEAQIIDVGANVGYFALGCKKILPKAGLFCLEPGKQAYEALLKNMGKLEKVKTLQLAAGNQKTTAAFYVDPGDTARGFVEAAPPTKEILQNREAVSVVRLDDLRSGSQLPQTVDLLKIDVEGYEIKVLEGAQQLLKNCHYLHLEFNSKNYLLSDLLAVISRSRKFQIKFIRNFSLEPDDEFNDGDLLLELV